MHNDKFTVGFATPQEMDGVYQLRYRDMVLEYRADNVNDMQTDRNNYDEYARHIVVKDAQTGEVVGYYRMITDSDLTDGRRFVCEEEYDLTELKRRGDKICEFSRAVVKREYRGGTVLLLLWRFILRYMIDNGYRYMIGDASFFGTDRDKYAKEISFLTQQYAADPSLKIRSLDTLPPMEMLDASSYDSKEVLRSLPPLIKAYVALGAKIADQPFVDTVFGSVDVFILVDLADYNAAFARKLLSL